MKLKIKNIPTSFLFGLFFLFILSFSVSSTWAKTRTFPGYIDVNTNDFHYDDYEDEEPEDCPSDKPVGGDDFCRTCFQADKDTPRFVSSSRVVNRSYSTVICSSCRTGQEYVGGQCRDNCMGGKIRSGDYSCVCQLGQEYVSGQCRASCTGGQERVGTECLSSCTSGKVRDGNSCRCPSGQEYVSVSGQCRASCIGEKVASADRSACISCPSGQVVTNGNCTCPEGEVYRSGSCQTPVTAQVLSGDQFKEAQACKSVCPLSSSSCRFEDSPRMATPGKKLSESALSYKKVDCN